MSIDRPFYENDKNRADEQRIATALGEKFQCKFRKLPMFYALDYLAMRDETAVIWAEIKKRSNKFGAYKDFRISLSKYKAAHDLTNTTGLPSQFFIEFDDGLYMHRAKYPITVGIIGRTDRGDWQDVEPAAVIKWEDFRKVDV